MPSLADHTSQSLVKMLLIGDSKAGKTGSLTSLVKAGFKLRILDLDNLLGVLRQYIQMECPEMMGNVEFFTIRDAYKAGALGPMISGKPKAWVEAVKMMDHWKDGDTDLGVPAEWGTDCILVIDSLSRLCDAAYDYHESIIPTGKGGQFDGRAVYGNAQDAVEKFLAMLTSDTFATNVVVIAHVQYQDQPDGSTKGFPQGVGQKLSPKIPQYFSSVGLMTKKGEKRTLRTTSTTLIDLANPAPFKMGAELPIETGMATFFETLGANPSPVARDPVKPQVQPASTVTRIRR